MMSAILAVAIVVAIVALVAIWRVTGEDGRQ